MLKYCNWCIINIDTDTYLLDNGVRGLIDMYKKTRWPILYTRHVFKTTLQLATLASVVV